jgi:CDP-glycerol glycerophosphotransferase
VIDAVRDLDGVRRGYATAYAEFKAHFLDLDDGHAAERLVDAAFRPDEY